MTAPLVAATVSIAWSAGAFAIPLQAQSSAPDPAAIARASLDGLIASSRAPGLQYMVVDASRTLLDYAGGWADLRAARALEPATTMMAYSMSKTITAVAILQLAGSGRLGLDDPVSRYVPESGYGPGVTIRRLLSHTAGVPSPVPLRWVHLVEAHDQFNERAALRAVLSEHASGSEPGKRYKYSNIGYWLLGFVVEQVSGEPFTVYVERHVLAPLGIAPGQLGYRIPDAARHATGYLEKYSLINLAKGFFIDDAFIGEYDDAWLRINPHYLNGPAFGGLVGTAGGWGLFLQDQLRAQSAILPAQARSLLYEQQRVASGAAVPMTLGWHVGELRGERYYYKEGGGGGFHAMMRLYPGRGIGTVIIANATAFNVAKALDGIDPEFFPRSTP